MKKGVVISSKSVVPMFGDVLDSAKFSQVNPKCCIPLTKIRPISKSGVIRLKHKFTGNTSEDIESGHRISAGSDAPVVVPLVGSMRIHLSNHFESIGLSTKEASVREEVFSVWYGIVDGNHRHTAVLELVQEQEDKWDGFMWPVLVLRGGHPLHRLRQLARSQNWRHGESFYVETTLYDLLSGLKEEYERLKTESNGKRPVSADVAAAFDGSVHAKDSTVKQAANTSARLPASVIDTIGLIINSEHPDICGSFFRSQLKRYGESNSVMSQMDCRVFRRFITLTSIKSATAFMKSPGPDGEAAQVNTLYRAREICRDNGFKPTSHHVISEQYQLSRDAIRESKTFEKFLESSDWPLEMETMKDNLLRSPRLDKEIIENRGNDMFVLKPLYDQYKRLFPSLAEMRMEKYRASLRISKEDRLENGTSKSDQCNSHTASGASGRKVPDIESTKRDLSNKRKLPGEKEDSCSASISVDNSAHQYETDIPISSKEIPTPTEHTDSVEHRDYEVALESARVFMYDMSWQTYDTTVRTRDDPPVDMILTDPQTAANCDGQGIIRDLKGCMDHSEMKDFSSFCRRSMKSGGYVVLFTPYSCFQSWSKCFSDSGFTVMGYPLVFVKRSDGMQHRRIMYFPQNNADYALLARAAGKHPDGYKPDFESPFHQFKAGIKRRFAAVPDVPNTGKRLLYPESKAPVRVDEKCVELLSELVDMFCPADGTVLDAFAGTMKTGIACIRMKRGCTLIEKDQVCFKLSMSRLALNLMTLNGSDHNKLRRYTKKRDEKSTKELSKNLISTPIKSHIESMDGTGSRPTKTYRREAPGTVSEQAVITMKPPITTGKPRTGTELPSDVIGGNAKTTCNGMEECTVSYFPGSNTVDLLISDEVVGTAVLRRPSDDETGIITVLHGSSLEEYQLGGQKLAVIYKVKALRGFGSRSYPYSCPGVEGTPDTILSASDGGMYAWDIHQMK